KLKMYLEDIDAIFVEGDIDQDYVYGIYFMPAELEEKIDGIFSALYFERIIISADSHGTPEAACEAFRQRERQLEAEAEALQENIRRIVQDHAQPLLAVYRRLKTMEAVKALRRAAAHTRESFYVSGWVAEPDTRAITARLQKEPNVIVVEEEPDIIQKAKPPIKLKNPRLFRPFQMFVEMYGLPSYTEIDPTPVLSLSYILLFGIMFGDVGHGLILLVGGALLYKLKKMDLAGIVAQAGAVSAIFGLLYGSLFGNEEILRHNPVTGRFFLLSPMEDINTILIGTVALGAVIIIIAMLLGMVNCIKNRQWGKLLFSPNGVAGLVFYGFVLLLVVNIFFPLVTIPAPLSALCIGVPLLLMFLQEPLERLLAGRKDWLPQSKGEFVMESFFELFEVILSYATNTISFVRLGAFALGHGSMMSVVFILADMFSGAGRVVVLILGNALVIGLEGLIVGIQSLRLEFYEMFSRFYEGGGRPFISIRNAK
ncbi:MAG: V-type ATP synthase subunit I, partial [Clostridia bacterium]